MLFAAALVGPAALLVPARASAQTENDGRAIEQAVVAITVTQQAADWYSPWQSTRPVETQGSGFLIAPGRVLTNAHVVSDAKQIIVRHSEDNTPYFAKVAFIAHDSDLALLQVDAPGFSKGVTPLALGGLPSLRSRVRTYGFPAGGEKISRTEGVVSRVEFITYVHSGADSHLGIQTDSAINPGNSGGPVLQDGKVVGVAFQVNPRLSDVGYFIPTPVVRRFLADIKDGRYDGYGELGLATSNLINPVYRRYLGMPAGMSGVVVDRVIPEASAAGFVHPDDVVTAIDGKPVASDGTIKYDGYSLKFEQGAEEKQIGDTVELSLWRKGRALKVTFPLQGLPGADLMRSQFDVQPQYFIYAGLVFMELDKEFLRTFGNYWQNADKHLLYAQFFENMESPEGFKTHIVLSRVLPHRINNAYRGMANLLLTSVNGRPITRLQDIPQALKHPEGAYEVFKLDPGGLVLVLDKAEADVVSAGILKAYGIDRAERLK